MADDDDGNDNGHNEYEHDGNGRDLMEDTSLFVLDGG
jgi:hypothetical protein